MIERRRDSVHALLVTLLLSQGTPMLLAGDEHGHSQHGNNNAYCQDNALTWLDWGKANRGLTAFTAALIHLRRRIPALTGNRWWQEGDGSVRWLNQHAQPLSADEWQHGVMRLQIQLSERWLITLNATQKSQIWNYLRENGTPFFRSPERAIRSSWMSGMGPRTECAYFKGRKP
ncbi:Glycogen debranching enzyme [Raoultella terrigena]|uniref:Glycogen debranching enzyme n=1 Tax=Raoultella terrigena TaxID=577 RepID=A0A3P8LZR5_RAOTE|nr:Glycogen debranching enzyme [Raoultella terrigena]